jgi:hypothetical protein
MFVLIAVSSNDHSPVAALKRGRLERRFTTAAQIIIIIIIILDPMQQQPLQSKTQQ